MRRRKPHDVLVDGGINRLYVRRKSLIVKKIPVDGFISIRQAEYAFFLGGKYKGMVAVIVKERLDAHVIPCTEQ